MSRRGVARGGGKWRYGVRRHVEAPWTDGPETDEGHSRGMSVEAG
jgi:hypothetical protein